MAKVVGLIFALVLSNGIYGGLTALIVFGINEIFGKSYGYTIPLTVVCGLATLAVLFQAFVLATFNRKIRKDFGDFDKKFKL